MAYLPADVDRLYWRTNQPDHGDLLASLTRWVAGGDPLTVRVEGPGLVDVHAYVQGGTQPEMGSGALAEGRRVIVHLVNLTHANGWKAPVDELIDVGAQRVSVTLPVGRRAGAARLLVAAQRAEVTTRAGSATVTVPALRDHEVVVLELS